MCDCDVWNMCIDEALFMVTTMSPDEIYLEAVICMSWALSFVTLIQYQFDPGKSI